ncbi:hypothetical protein BH11MYX3_BH11MYX3_06100 [soil metagenome]
MGWRGGNDLASTSLTLLEGTTVIRRLGSHAGKRIYFGYDRYIRPELITYRDALGRHGELVDAVDEGQLHYLTSAELVCTAVQADPESFGVLCCGTGMGMSIAANKFHGIYAARCMSVEDAELARTINNANVLCLAAKQGFELNQLIIDTFVRTAYTGRKLDELELITRFEGAPAPSLRVVRRTA